MKVFQKWNDDSLNICFTSNTNQNAPDVSISEDADGNAIVRLNGNKIPEKENPNPLDYQITLPEATEASPAFVQVVDKLYYKAKVNELYQYIELGNGSITPPTPGPSATSSGELSVQSDESLDGQASNQRQINLQNTNSIKCGLAGWQEDAEYASGDLVVYQGKVYKSIEANNRGNNPSTGYSSWERIALSTAIITTHDFNSMQVFDPATIYLIKDCEHYTRPVRYSINSKGADRGWTVSAVGISNLEAHRVVTWEYAPELIDGELAPYLEVTNNGLICTAINAEGNKVCRFNEPYVDLDNYSARIYNPETGWIEIFNKNTQPFSPYVFEATAERYIEGTHIMAPYLTEESIRNIATNFVQSKVALVKYSHAAGDTNYINVVQAYISTDVSSVTLLFWYDDVKKPYLINYVQSSSGVTVDTVDLSCTAITLPTEVGDITEKDLNTLKLNECVKLRYWDTENDRYEYLSKSNEILLNGTPSTIVYRGENYSCEIGLNSRGYILTRAAGTLIIDTPRWDTVVANLNIPTITPNEFYEILGTYRDGRRAIIKWEEGCCEVIQAGAVDGGDPYIKVIVRSQYFKQDFYVEYTAADKIVTFTVTPVKYFDVTLTETSGNISDEAVAALIFFKDNARIRYAPNANNVHYLYSSRIWQDGYYYQGGDKFCSVDTIEKIFTIRDNGYLPSNS